MGCACSTYGIPENCVHSLSRICKGNRCMPRWKDNIKVDLREMHSDINQPEGLELDSRRGERDLISMASRPALGPTDSPVLGYRELRP
jgi:hypothetical protein